MKLIGIKEVMDILGIGRPTATKLLERYLGKYHKKGQKFLVNEENFLLWVKEGMK